MCVHMSFLQVLWFPPTMTLTNIKQLLKMNESGLWACTRLMKLKKRKVRPNQCNFSLHKRELSRPARTVQRGFMQRLANGGEVTGRSHAPRTVQRRLLAVSDAEDVICLEHVAWLSPTPLECPCFGTTFSFTYD